MNQACFFPWKNEPWLPFEWVQVYHQNIKSNKNSNQINWEITDNHKKCQQIIKENSVAEWKTAGAFFASQLWNNWSQSLHVSTTWSVCVQTKSQHHHWNAYWSGFWLAIDAIPRETPELNRPNKKTHNRLTVFVKDSQLSEEEWNEERTWADATIWVRTLQDCPANKRSPEILAKLIQDSCQKLPSVRIETHSSKDSFLKNWGGIQGIHQGATHDHPAYLVTGEYKPQTQNKKSTKSYVLIGKGVNFDTGGLALKNPEKMSLMKMDLTGALCAFATFYTCAYLQKPIQLSVVLPFVDNVIGSHAILPGSVVKLYGNTTIEIVDPDAEGRVILAEASNYASEKYPDYEAIVVGTLTGQIDKVGNGLYSAIFRKGSKEEEWMAAAEESQELLWDCPLQKAFEPLLHSTVADYVNINEDVTADMLWCGYFLSKFWKPKTNWSFIDLTGIISTPFQIPWIPKVGHGVGVQLMRAYLV